MRADDPDVYEVTGPPELPAPAATVIRALTPVVTEARRQRIDEVVASRTEDVVLVLDSIADPHNASAILRSADAFGLQTVHVIPSEHGFVAARGVAKGTHRWLDIVRHKNAESCIVALRERQYSIFAAVMDGQHTPAELRRNADRIAVVFGNEHKGISKPIREAADGTFAIPMRGFVESLNVSVAAAITCYALTAGGRAPLSAPRREELRARYLMNSVRDAQRIVVEHLAKE